MTPTPTQVREALQRERLEAAAEAAFVDEWPVERIRAHATAAILAYLGEPRP